VRVRAAGGRPGAFHLVTRDSWLQQRVLKGSVCSFPADNPLVLAVGAVDEAGDRAEYSPAGPAAGRLKPELVAPSPFAAGGVSFGGTSAAAPQVAGVAALLAGKHPAWTAKQLREVMEKQAVRLGAKPNNETGYGRVALPAPAK
jgi:subtilisin family serine protease